MTTRVGSSVLTVRKSSSPSMSGRRRSVMSRSKLSFSKRWSPAMAEEAQTTLYASSDNASSRAVNRFVSSSTMRIRSGLEGISVSYRQNKRKGGAVVRNTVYGNCPTVRFHHAFADGQSQSHPSLGFRRKKWTKNLRQRPWGNTRAGICHRNANHRVIRRPAIQMGCAGIDTDSQRSSFRHGFESVEEQVKQDLFQLLGIGEHEGEVLGSLEDRMYLLLVCLG